jgi:hypothetical protein
MLKASFEASLGIWLFMAEEILEKSKFKGGIV